jgi:NADH-quinone oxidoreductase subunit G
MHPEAARNAGMSEGQMAKIGDGTGSATLPVVLSAAIAEGCVWIETCHAASSPLSQTMPLAITRAGL